MEKNCAIILAAGEGTRMKSSRPKVLAEVLFKPMLDWVVDTTRQSGTDDICVITGHMSETVVAHLGEGIETAVQHQRLGTGHAVMQARDFITRHGDANVLILAGDAPLMDTETILCSLDFHQRGQNAATVISAKVENPFGYGRILRDEKGTLTCIVEEKDATDAQKTITEVNSGAFWFKGSALLTALDRLQAQGNISPKDKECYLTDTIEILAELYFDVAAFLARTSHVVLGANDRIQLAQLSEIARREELNRHMLGGVSIPCADGIMIGPDVEIGAETIVLPGSILRGKVTIGTCCTIGPNALIENSTIGNKVHLNATQCSESTVADGAQIGPFVRIRPGSAIGECVHIGNFVEIKNSSVDSETKISHLSYIGDTDVGSDVNVGCGCATVNFNGNEKNRTVIKDGAFIGCNTNLVAPVTVGKDAYTAAGSTITEDVPDSSLAIARAKQVNKEGWVDTKKPFRRQHPEQE